MSIVEIPLRGTRVIPQPEPGLTVDDFIARSRSLRPRLLAEQAETELRTRYSPELHEEVTRLGFFRILEPTAFGGYELSVTDFLRVVAELAQGCGSTAWSIALGASHVVNLAAVFPPEVQWEVMGETGHFVSPNRAVPSVVATRTATGWRLDGVWDYSSRAPYSTHVLSAVRIAPADGAQTPPEFGLAIVPRDRYTVLDDWGTTIGLKGSGSNSVRLEGAEVPAGYVQIVDLQNFDPAEGYGVSVHGNPMYTGRVQPFVWAELHALALGIVRAMIDEYRAVLLSGKRTMWPPMSVRRDDPDFQHWYGRAAVMADAAETIILGAGDRFTELATAAAEGHGDPAAELRLVAQVNQAGSLLAETMDLLVRTGGSSLLNDGSRTQRCFRDFWMFRSHVASTMEEFMTRQTAIVDLAVPA